MRFTKFLGGLLAMVALGLAGCGGGGSGGAGTPVVGPGAGTGTGTGTTATAPKLAITLSSATVTAASPAQVVATLTTAAGAPIPGQVVTFATSGNLGSFSAASALTDASGQATTNLVPATTAASGADTVVASYQSGGTVLATASTGFQLTATNVTIASFTSDITTNALSAFGQTSFTVSLSGTTPTAPVTVSLSSSCVAKGRASLTPGSATVSTGRAVFIYRDLGCGATDTVDNIQASVVGTGATASLQLTLASPTASSIAFVSATPDTVFLKGTGLAENASVVFQVRDANGMGLPDLPVVFSSTTFAGGLLVDGLASNEALALPQNVKKTDFNGNVTVRINAGTVPTPVRITAAISGVTPRISTVSSNLAVAVGLPAQNNFSLSQGTHNIEGFNVDGQSNTYTIIASDRLGNPVPAGTSINFIASGGQVQAVGFTAVSGGLAKVTVNFQSSAPRPADGRVTVLAYALGEESFLDRNGNNFYDAGEDHQDLGDVFLDRLFNGTYNADDDQFVSLQPSGAAACRVATSTLLQLEPGQPSITQTEALAPVSSCVAGWGSAYVRRAIQTVMSTSSARPVYGTAVPGNSTASSLAACSAGAVSLIRPIGELPYNPNDSANRATYFTLGSVGLYNLGKAGVVGFLLADSNPVALNPMPAGTTIRVSATTGLTVAVAGGSPVPSTLSPTGAAINYSFDDTTSSGTATITFTSPGGLSTSYLQNMYKGVVPAGQVACP